MRPAGDIRAALRKAADSLAPVVANDGMTYLDMACRGCVGREVARSTVKDMVKAGELAPVGARKVDGIKRPLRTYLPVSYLHGGENGAAALSRVLGNWATQH